MIALTCAATLMRRLLGLRPLLLAVTAGALVGALVAGLPDPSLAADLFPALVFAAGATLVLPLAAGPATSDRQGGLEALVALRPVGSLSWAAGRLLGTALASLLLVLLVAETARLVGGRVRVPLELVATRMNPGLAEPTWRFALPAGSRGPFPVTLEVEAPGPLGGRLGLELRRGDGVATPPDVRVSRRLVELELPDLWPERGDLFLTLRPRGAPRLDGAPAAGGSLVLSDEPPRLELGGEPIGEQGLPLPRGSLPTLVFAALAAMAAACAFHFETACLAGLLALLVRTPSTTLTWVAACGLLLLFAAVGTVLSRRSALP